MSITSSGEVRSPRRKNLKLNGETTVENNQGESWDKVEHSSDQQTRVELPGKLEVHDTLAISGIRPVSSSDLQVVETKNIMGIRPTTANTFHVVDTLNMSGARPIGSSDLVISETYSVMGNRPIASNTIDDSESLMGFLD
ncbi:hypothetical protein [Brasilonema bromeliae]|uniref:Uncharacterized protein n=1 Tax=Brasilonema bromeliae SPC951 TaxID=385972 RepID=A0ABX1PDZ1_9CYAN|nr:hypothetical protein [Brasilonema bromeliae]NMG22173.1 hypothetical protein [Brasilonema bromeliae SPC951]